MKETDSRDRTSFETKIQFVFVAAIIVVFALATITWKVEQDARATTHKVAHTLEVLNDLANVRGDSLQVELSTQNFRLTGNEALLAERDNAITTRETRLDRIRALTVDDPIQQDRWTRLRAVIDERLEISRRVEALRRTEGLEAANAFVATAPLKSTRELAYGLLRAMEDEELRLLDRRNRLQSASIARLFVAAAVLSAALSVLLFATYFVIRRQLRETGLAQRSLAESERNLSTTLDSIGDAVLATDTRGRITRMNPVAERLTGWPLIEARGRQVAEVFRIINEKTRTTAADPVARTLETGQTQTLENHTALMARDGTEYPISDSAAPIRDQDNELRGVVLVFRDVRIEREAERVIEERNVLLERSVEERTAQLRESQAHLRDVIGNVPALIAYVDANERYVYVNEQYRNRFAAGNRDITGCTVREVLGDSRYEIARPRILQALQGVAQDYDWEPFPSVWQAIHYAPRQNATGDVDGYYVLGTDITERKLSEGSIRALNIALEQHVRELGQVSRALRTLSAGNRAMLRSTEKYGLLNSMCEAIVTAGGYGMAMVWYRVDDEASSLRPMAERGYPGGLAGLGELEVSWADNAHGRGAVGTSIRTGRTVVIGDTATDSNYRPWSDKLYGARSVIACPLRVGGQVIGALAICDAEPDTFGADEIALLSEMADDLAFGIGMLRAQLERQKAQEAVYRLTRFDSLTGLPNETHFTELLAAAVEAGQRCGHSFAVLQSNVERLTDINDTLGFVHGDEMLCEFAVRVRSATPEGAMIARLRGDEFAVLLPEGNAETATALARRLDDALARPFAIADIALPVSARTGIVLFPEHGSTTHDLYRHMDIAVNHAKKKGLAHYIFDPAQNPARTRSLTIASELRRAIENNELRLYVQPKLEVATCRLSGAEGLVRWHHPAEGLIPPSRFIELAEHTGLIKPLTEWVIDAAVELTRAWGRDGTLVPIAVNLSARNLRDETLLERIRRQQGVGDSGLSLLEMEITEGTLMEDAELSLNVLHGLRNAGILLYIDDYGTGYSSLSYLEKLPVDYIKIDQSFVRGLPHRKDSTTIVRSTIDLVHDLGRKVVAEGVETQAQWNLLAEMGCDYAQGYFIARPMPAAEFRNWAERFRTIGFAARDATG